MIIKEEAINQISLNLLDAHQASCSPCQLLQSSTWLKFQEAVGYKAHLFFWEKENETGYFVAFEHRLPFGKKYYYISRGPVLNNKELWPEFITEIKKYFKAMSALIFVRFEPDSSFSFQDDQLSNLCHQVADVQPSHTFLTDLNNNEEQLLGLMHPKTRYNIRLGLKKKLKFISHDTALEKFLDLLDETSRRDKFVAHNKNYYRQMIASGAASLNSVYCNNILLASGIFAIFGDTMTYLHGASASDKRELMAPYVLHWEMIKQARAKNLKHYDWHGINEKKWPGFTRFKRGFGGHDIHYPGTFDLVLAPAIYLGYNSLRGIRRLLLSFRLR